MSNEVPDTAPPSDGPDSLSREFVSVWAESIAHVLTQIAGSPVGMANLAELPPQIPPESEGDLQVTAVAAGALQGETTLRLPRAVGLALAQLFLGEPQNPAAESKPDYKEAVEELLRQIAGQVATGLRPRWGEVQLRIETTATPSGPAAANGCLKSASDVPCPIWMEWRLSAALLSALEAASSPSPEASESAPETEPALNTGIVAGNLDLLMDVELEVMLRFGERSMQLQEILELGSGSVVELDRRIEEPADLLLDGRLIARGEVVVVDGNYGLRVLEVVSPQSSSQAAGA